LRRRRIVFVLVVPLLLALAACNPVMHLDAITRVNETRTALGRPPLRVTDELTRKALLVADHLAEIGRLEHSPDLAAGITGPYGRLGENVGYGSSVEQIHASLLHSPEHFSIMIDPRYTEIGIGITVGVDGTVYEVQEYKAP
jgi:uncharacterized protein YkwD